MVSHKGENGITLTKPLFPKYNCKSTIEDDLNNINNGNGHFHSLKGHTTLNHLCEKFSNSDAANVSFVLKFTSQFQSEYNAK